MNKLDVIWTLLNTRIDEINQRVSVLEAKEMAQTADEVTQLTLVDAQASSPPGIAFRYITDGLREGGGVGTLSYFDGSSWRRVSDNAVVTT